MVNFEENLIKEYTANTVNKEDNTDVNESDEENGKESTQSKQNQCAIKSYGEAMDLIEQLKLFCAEKNLAFIEDVVEIEAKMISVPVNSSSVQTKLESYFKHLI